MFRTHYRRVLDGLEDDAILGLCADSESKTVDISDLWAVFC